MSGRIHYSLSYNPINANCLEVSVLMENQKQNSVDFKIPYWRPGRYEAADYFRNVKAFRAFSGNRSLKYKRIDTHTWRVFAESTDRLEVQYQYYAQRMDAGGAWVDEDLFYINPVNCLMFAKGFEHVECSVELKLTEDYLVATGMPEAEGYYLAENFDHLADSPILASADLQHHSFIIDSVPHHIWFHGRLNPDWERLEKDFTAYTKEQLKVFGDFPEKEFHYLYLISNSRAYHGVEHRNSTVIYLGPGEEVMNNRYDNLLGVSSHELFHCWNVKCIRPSDMLPYNFEGPNYSELGYVYEGFTTYYGDLMLSRSDVFDKDQYFLEINTYLKRHAYNYGRFNLSVADSSYSTWADGYAEVVPNRKTSIYVEGALNAMILDLKLRKKQSSLDDLMKMLYDRKGKKGEGYTRQDLIDYCTELGMEDASAHFEKFYDGVLDLSSALNEELESVGCYLEEIINDSKNRSLFGFALDSSLKVKALAPGSPAAIAGLSLDDEIIAIDNWKVSSSNLSDLCDNRRLWITFFDKKGKLQQRTVNAIPNCFYYSRFEIRQKEQVEAEKKHEFRKWCGKDF